MLDAGQETTPSSPQMIDVVHDLRAPLAALACQVRSLASSELPPGLAYEVELMGRTLNMLSERVDSALVRERESVVAAVEPLDLWRIAHEVVQQLRPLVRARTKTITLSGAPGVPVTGCREDLESAVQNLVDNAVRHAADGGSVSVVVSSRRSLAMVSVSDDGPGIAPGDRERALRAFESGREGGTGLGLAVASRVARSHGGDLRIADAPAGGALVELSMPRRRLDGRRRQRGLRLRTAASRNVAGSRAAVGT